MTSVEIGGRKRRMPLDGGARITIPGAGLGMCEVTMPAVEYRFDVGMHTEYITPKRPEKSGPAKIVRFEFLKTGKSKFVLWHDGRETRSLWSSILTNYEMDKYRVFEAPVAEPEEAPAVESVPVVEEPIEREPIDVDKLLLRRLAKRLDEAKRVDDLSAQILDTRQRVDTLVVRLEEVAKQNEKIEVVLSKLDMLVQKFAQIAAIYGA